MARFDRYLLSQLLVLFGFFALVLISVYWVNRAVVLFDRLIADGHSARVFLEFSALSLPPVIAQVLPMSAFAGAVYVTNRLSGDSELTVMQATGFSPWRLARPVLYYGLIVAVMMTLLTHLLVPASVKQLRQREVEISASVSARLLREGTFLHPARGVTLFIRDITPEGELQDIYLSDRRDPDRAVAYTAERAYLVRENDTTQMVMVKGQAQRLNTESQSLSLTEFADYSQDISTLIEVGRTLRPRLNFLPTFALLADPEGMAEIARSTPAKVLEEAHQRFAQPLLCLCAALIGFAALQTGGFSRFGLARQIVFAIFLLVLIKMVESAVTGPVRGNTALWPLVYAPVGVGLAISWVLLWRAARPRRSPPAEAPA